SMMEQRYRAPARHALTIVKKSLFFFPLHPFPDAAQGNGRDAEVRGDDVVGQAEQQVALRFG
ncbi:hypothetical protein RZS08_44375, partial [Arthrospira platensis SPKY1]|nr:hypothetical protein [Arthrospira platensis SPKY1]